MKKTRLKKLLNALSPDTVLSEKFKAFDEDVAGLKKRLVETIHVETIDDVKVQLNKFQKKIDFSEIQASLKSLEAEVTKRSEALTALLERESGVSAGNLEAYKKEVEEMRNELLVALDKTTEISTLRKAFEEKIKSVEKSAEASKREAERLLAEQVEEVKSVRREIEKRETGVRRYIDDKEVSLRDDMKRGGAAHFQVNVNSSVASRKYADINFRSNTAIRWVATDDDTNKRVDIVPSLIQGGGGGGTPGGSNTQVQFNDNNAFGGDPALTWAGSVFTVGQPGSVVGRINFAGATAQTVGIQAASTAGNWVMTLPVNDGSTGQYLLTDGNGITQWASVTAVGGSGITRNVSIITANTTAADSASVDYVYFAEAGMQFTLPTAVGNSNLYTVKNHSNSSVLVIAPEGVDGSATALMPSNNESLSFMSNNSIWGVV